MHLQYYATMALIAANDISYRFNLADLTGRSPLEKVTRTLWRTMGDASALCFILEAAHNPNNSVPYAACAVASFTSFYLSDYLLFERGQKEEEILDPSSIRDRKH